MQYYKRIPHKSAVVNYNLGNCAYKLGQKGYALLYWRRAEHAWKFTGREELLENIFLLKGELQKIEKKSMMTNARKNETRETIERSRSTLIPESERRAPSKLDGALMRTISV